MKIRLTDKLLFAAIVALVADAFLLEIKFNAVPHATMRQPAPPKPKIIEMPPLVIVGSTTQLFRVDEVAEIWDEPCVHGCTEPHHGDGDGVDYQVDVPMTDETLVEGPVDH